MMLGIFGFNERKESKSGSVKFEVMAYSKVAPAKISNLCIFEYTYVSLYRGNEFAILRVFESQKSPFTTKIAG
jgi:hypothetical protein